MLFSKRSNVSKVEKERIEYSFVRNTENKLGSFHGIVCGSHMLFFPLTLREKALRGEDVCGKPWSLLEIYW
jgi:hypothetical protein